MDGRTIYTMCHAMHAQIFYMVSVYNAVYSTLKLVTSGLLYSDTVSLTVKADVYRADNCMVQSFIVMDTKC